jgi:urease accessory protein
VHLKPDGEIRLALMHKDGGTRLKQLYQAQPLRVLFPLPPRGDIFQAAIALVSGGLVGGDHLRVEIEVEQGARALVIGQAAEKVYRSLGADCVIDNRIAVAPQAWLEFLPQETILFDHARLRRSTVVRLVEGGRFLGGDIVVFGRKARGESFRNGLLHDVWEVRQADDTLVWKDVLHLDGAVGDILASPGFGGAAAFATMLYGGPDAQDHLSALRVLAAQMTGVRIGATQFRGLLIVRFVGTDAFLLRKSFAVLWGELRARAAGLPACLPRLWAI